MFYPILPAVGCHDICQISVSGLERMSPDTKGYVDRAGFDESASKHRGWRRLDLLHEMCLSGREVTMLIEQTAASESFCLPSKTGIQNSLLQVQLS